MQQSKLTCAAGVDRDRAARLLMQLERQTQAPIHLRINNNASTLLSLVRPRDGSPVRFSVHKMFLGAPEEVTTALGQYITRATPACQAVLRRYMDEHTDDLHEEHSDPKTLTLRSRGRVYDLHKLADEVNREFFHPPIQINITWSRGAVEPARGRRRHIIFGSYDRRNALIRIHPALDSEDVPEFFVKFVIYHEMLHHVLDPRPQPGGRRCVHTPQFRDRERRHPDYRRALEWEAKFMTGRHKEA